MIKKDNANFRYNAYTSTILKSLSEYSFGAVCVFPKRKRKWRFILILIIIFLYTIRRLSYQSVSQAEYNSSFKKSRLPKINDKRHNSFQSIETIQQKYKHLKQTFKKKAKSDRESKIALIFPEGPNTKEEWLKSLNHSKYELHPYPYMSPQSYIPHRIPMNRGNEAMTYLTFIIEHYEALPDIMFFFHNQERTWHQLKTMTYILNHMKWDELPAEYINLRRCDHVSVNNPWPVAIKLIKEFWDDLNLPMYGFPSTKEIEMNKSRCCAQFIIRKELIMAHDKAFYELLSEWLISTAKKPRISATQRINEFLKPPGITKYDSYRAGEIFEHSWHILFSGNVIEEEEPLDCYSTEEED